MTNKEIIQKSIKTFGMTSQIIKCIEELSELQKALCKYLNKDYNRKAESDEEIIYNIIDKIADVEIMIENMKMHFEIDNEAIENIKNDKLNRLNKWIDQYNKDK